MRRHRFGATGFLLGVVLLAASSATAQPPRGGFGGPPGGGDRGGDRGSRGGSSRGMDPDRIFSFMAKGGDTIDFRKMDPNQRAFAGKMLERMGVPPPNETTVITKDQFVRIVEQSRAARESGSPPAAAPGGPPPGYGGPPPGYGGPPPGSSGGSPFGKFSERDVEGYFERYDRDKDGRLSQEEGQQSSGLRDAFEKYDRNRDRSIDMGEWKAYMAEKYGGDGNDRDDRGRDSGRDRGRDDRGRDRDRGRDDKKADAPRAIAIRFGKLPEGLPSWFTELDTDQDGQVGLYEWREAGKDMNEFVTMDLDRDCLLAPAEMLRYIVIKAEQDKLAAANGEGTEGGEYGATGSPASGGSSRGSATPPGGTRGPWGAPPSGGPPGGSSSGRTKSKSKSRG